MAGKKEILVGSLRQLKLAKRMAKKVKDAKAEQAAKKRRLPKIKKIAEKLKKQRIAKEAKGKLVPARPSPKKEVDKAPKKPRAGAGSPGGVGGGGRADLGVPAGVKAKKGDTMPVRQGQKKRAPLSDRRREFDDLPKPRQRGEIAKVKAGKTSRFTDIIKARISKTPPTKKQLDDLRTPLAKGGMKKQYGAKNFMYGGSVMGKKKK